MKAIESAGERDKRRKRNQIILGVIMIGLMLLSTAGYAVMNWEGTGTNSGKIKYGNYTLLLENGFWTTEINGEKFYFEFLPNETSGGNNLNLGGLKVYSDKPLYIVSQDSYLAGKVATNLGNSVERINPACISGENCTSSDLPVKNCSTDNVIIIKDYDKPTVEKKEKCVFIGAENYLDKKKAIDEFFYRLLGIKNKE